MEYKPSEKIVEHTLKAKFYCKEHVSDTAVDVDRENSELDKVIFKTEQNQLNYITLEELIALFKEKSFIQKNEIYANCIKIVYNIIHKINEKNGDSIAMLKCIQQLFLLSKILIAELN